MKDNSYIKNLDDLEKEIHFLERESKIIEGKLNNNLAHLKRNYLSMTLKTILSKTNHSKNWLYKRLLVTTGIKETINTFSDNIAGKAAGAFKSMAERFFNYKKH